MNIAAIQLACSPRHRAAMLRAALTAIAYAGQDEPSPDLIVLPALFEAAHPSLGHDEVFEPIHGATRAAFAEAAREWGVPIAFAMAGWDGDRRIVAGVLLDADGDTLIVQPQMHLPQREQRGFTAGTQPIASASSPDGVVLLPREDATNEEAWNAAAGIGAKLIVGSICTAAAKGEGKSLKDLARWARRLGVAAVIAAAAGEDHAHNGVAQRTGIIAAGGKLIAHATGGGTHIVTGAL